MITIKYHVSFQPQEMQGRSFKPLLMGETVENWRKSIYYHYYDHGIHNVARHDGVRNDRYKLIHFLRMMFGNYTI
jgi:hypothetical protein